jgi:predicted RNA-binding protein with PUA-like domain
VGKFLKKYWLIKSEPTVYPFNQLLVEKQTAWTGIRNYTARNNLKAMQLGDALLFYHSNVGKEIVGLAKVVKTFYQDPTSQEAAWVCVDVAPVKKFSKPVSLETIKKHAVLKNMQIVKLSRMSVSAVTPEEFKTVCALANQ